MILTKEQIELKKKVGKSKGKDIWYYKGRGGPPLIADHTGKVIGAGSHRAVARFQAQREDPDICWELSKHEHFSYSDFEHLIPESDELLARIQALQDKSK